MNPFSNAQVALVAYVEVAADGTSKDINSGVASAKVVTGHFTITLPGGGTPSSPGPQGANQATQIPSRDLIFVQPMTSTLDHTPAVYEWSVAEDDATDPNGVKHIYIGQGGYPADPDQGFKLIVIRTLIPAVVGSPA